MTPDSLPPPAAAAGDGLPARRQLRLTASSAALLHQALVVVAPQPGRRAACWLSTAYRQSGWRRVAPRCQRRHLLRLAAAAPSGRDAELQRPPPSRPCGRPDSSGHSVGPKGEDDGPRRGKNRPEGPPEAPEEAERGRGGSEEESPAESHSGGRDPFAEQGGRKRVWGRDRREGGWTQTARRGEQTLFGAVIYSRSPTVSLRLHAGRTRSQSGSGGGASCEGGSARTSAPSPPGPPPRPPRAPASAAAATAGAAAASAPPAALPAARQPPPVERDEHTKRVKEKTRRRLRRAPMLRCAARCRSWARRLGECREGEGAPEEWRLFGPAAAAPRETPPPQRPAQHERRRNTVSLHAETALCVHKRGLQHARSKQQG